MIITTGFANISQILNEPLKTSSMLETTKTVAKTLSGIDFPRTNKIS